MISKFNFSFLAFGKTKESTEGGFKRYIGIASSKVLAVNPGKADLDRLLGYESQSDPEYFGSDENGKFARITFIVSTDPDSNNGVELKNRLTFTLYDAPAYNRDHTKVQVIDAYGNSSWTDVEDAKMGKKLFSSNGNPMKIADKYRMAYSGEADLVAFLKAYLCVDDAFNYTNGSWTLKPNTEDYVFGLEHIKDYFSGDISEIKEALALQPANKVKLLYGVRTSDDGKQYQTIATRVNFVLRNSAGSKAYAHLEKELFNAKQAGSYASTEFRVQPLQEYDVKPTDLSQAPAASTSANGGDDDMPWD